MKLRFINNLIIFCHKTKLLPDIVRQVIKDKYLIEPVHPLNHLDLKRLILAVFRLTYRPTLSGICLPLPFFLMIPPHPSQNVSPLYNALESFYVVKIAQLNAWDILSEVEEIASAGILSGE